MITEKRALTSSSNQGAAAARGRHQVQVGQAGGEGEEALQTFLPRAADCVPLCRPLGQQVRLPGSLVPGHNTSVSPLQALLLPGHLAAAGGRGLPRLHGIHLRCAAGRPLQADQATGEHRPHINIISVNLPHLLRLWPSPWRPPSRTVASPLWCSA